MLRIVKPQISKPDLLVSTLNLNDVKGHKSLSAFNPFDILSHFEDVNANIYFETDRLIFYVTNC